MSDELQNAENAQGPQGNEPAATIDNLSSTLSSTLSSPPTNDTPTEAAPAKVESIIPDGHTPVDVPEDAGLPDGTQVSMNADNKLVASVPTESGIVHILHEGEAFIEHLVETVTNYLKSL